MRTVAESDVTFLLARPILILFLAFFFASTLPNSARAGHDHIPCETCHLKTEAQLKGYTDDGSDFADSTLCLSCHDAGLDVSGFNPPHVLNGDRELAGGSFTPTLGSEKVGHNIVTVDRTLGSTPPGGAPLRKLGCRSCHDAHTNGNFRNLKKEINGRPTPVTAVGAPNFQETVYIYGMNGFCGGCHESFASGWNCGQVHPVGSRIFGARHTDIRRWFWLDNRVTQAEFPSGNPTDYYTAQVFCLSCHCAHASPNRDALRWDYSQTPQGCLECHSF